MGFAKPLGVAGFLRSDSSDPTDPDIAAIISARKATAAGSTVARTLAERFAEYCNVLDYGAVPDCTRGATGAATASDATFADASAAWTAADVGKPIVVHGAGAAGISLITTIASINSSTSIELTAAPSTTVASNCKYIYGTDNRAAFQAAIDEALDASAFKTVFIPDGDYFFSVSSTSLDPGAGGISFVGQSRESTILSFYEGPSTSVKYYLFSKTTTTRKGDLSFENIQFRGTLSQYARNTFGNPLYLDFYGNVSIRHCKFYDLAGAAMDFHSLLSFSVIDCYLEDIGRDGLRCRDTPDIIATGNTIKRTGDDAIAFHTADYQIEADLAAAVPIRERLIVGSNIVVNAGAVKVLGGKKVRVCNNVLHLTNVWGLLIHAIPVAEGSEGVNPVHDVAVSGNIITDTIFVDSATPQTATSYICVRGHTPRGATATNSIKPMRYNSTSGAIVKPWDWYQADESDSAYALPPSSGIVITSNTCRRTLPNAANFSDWGYGTKLASGVAYDPAMDDTDQRPTNGIHLRGADAFHGAIISDNIVEHTTIAIALPESSADELGVRNMQVTNNQLHDFTSKGVNIDGADAKHVGLIIQGNIIDGDFYRVASNSNIDGSYDADGDPTGIDIDAAEGVIVKHNKFSNVCRLIKSDTPTKCVIERNEAIAATPAATGFNTGNKGIGNIPVDYDFRYLIADQDPTSGTYNEISSVMVREASAQPSSGWYHAGWFVRNTSPTAAGGGPLGWQRITTGTGHTKGTDWIEITAGWVIRGKGTVAAHTGTTSETVLATVAIPANALGPNGIIRVTTFWSAITNSANNKTPRVRFGASGAGAGGTALRNPNLTTTVVFRDQVEIHNLNATNSQNAFQAAVSAGGWGTNANAASTAAIDTTAATEIAITAQLADSGETITLSHYLVETLYGA